MSRFLPSVALALLTCFAPGNAAAYKLITADVVSSYGSCSWMNNGDGTSTITLDMKFNVAAGRLGVKEFRSRGIIIYTYDANGKLRPSSDAARSIKINDVRHSWIFSDLVGGYVMYVNLASSDPIRKDWANTSAFNARVEVLIDNSVIANWPGIGVRAGNFTSGDDVGEITGAAYLSSMSGNSSCTVLEPTLPPPPPPAAITIDMAAPDWPLGELPRGESEKTLSGSAQQLCFTYTGVNSSRQFVIDAKSENGILNEKFFLKHVNKASQKIPYSLTLDSGVAKFNVPNANKDVIRLNNRNRTCFIPTFRTNVDMSVDTGNYGDVLSFTIVTKS